MNGDNPITLAYYQPGKALACLTTLAEQTADAPSLVTSGHDGFGTLYLGWTGKDITPQTTGHLNVAQIDASGCNPATGQGTFRVTPASKHTLTDSSSEGPALAYDTSHHELWAYWTGSNTSRHLNAGLFNGTNTLQQKQTAAISAGGPGAAYDENTGLTYVAFSTHQESSGSYDVDYGLYSRNVLTSVKRDGANVTNWGAGAGYDYQNTKVFDTFAGWNNQYLHLDAIG